MAKKYSGAFKARMVKKMSEAGAVSPYTLAGEVGISESSLYRWKEQAGTVGAVPKRKQRSGAAAPVDNRRRPQDFSPEEKLQVVLEAAGLSDVKLGEFLRRKGLHEVQLTEWRDQVNKSASDIFENPGARSSKKSPEARRVRELEKELRRKDKALAETAALLVLKKKANAIWGDEDDDMDPSNGQ